MRILYLDCFSGISGDMTVAALVDAGANKNYIERELKKLHLEPYELKWRNVVKCGVSGLKFDVVPDPQQPSAQHRHYSEIIKLIAGAGLNERVTALSLAIFEKIGKAEGKIHQVPLENVHFHEVGALDSIIDIVATALAIDSLKIDRVFTSPVPLGSGTVQCDHGFYPVPAPATLELMKGIPVAPAPYRMELTTPTGAAIISVIADDFMSGLPPMIVESIGYGAGTRDLPQQPNMLRAIIGHAEQLKTAVTPFQTQPHEHHHEHHHHEHHHHEHNRHHLNVNGHN